LVGWPEVELVFCLAKGVVVGSKTTAGAFSAGKFALIISSVLKPSKPDNILTLSLSSTFWFCG
jgi:hypothetical protein